MPCSLKRETEPNWLNLVLEFVSTFSINQHLETHHLKWPHRQFGINPGPFFQSPYKIPLEVKLNPFQLTGNPETKAKTIKNDVFQ